MDRIINVKVSGNYLSKDNKNAGVRGEANVTKLRITFDEGWDGYAKTVTFFDAHGNNPVRRLLTVDILENVLEDTIIENTNVYIIPIPKEPMAIAGELTFVIDGFKGEFVQDDEGNYVLVQDGESKRQRSLSDKLIVKDAPDTDYAGEPTDPTPTEPEQWQAQIERLMGACELAFNSSMYAGWSEDAAKQSKEKAKEYAEEAEAHAYKAENAVGKTSYIGDNGNWFAWDIDNKYFYDTGVRAQAGSEVYIGNNPPPTATVIIDPDGEATPITAYEIAVSQGFKGTEAEWVESLQGKTPQKGVDYWTDEDKAEITEYIDGQTAIIKADIEGIQEDIKNEAHFRGYLSTNAKIRALQGTPNDYAYSAESGTKWVYDAENGWQDTGTPVPDQLTPASETTPLINGVASVGTEQTYARGDHRHPTDTTRASVAELNALRADMEAMKDDIVQEILNTTPVAEGVEF